MGVDTIKNPRCYDGKHHKICGIQPGAVSIEVNNSRMGRKTYKFCLGQIMPMKIIVLVICTNRYWKFENVCLFFQLKVYNISWTQNEIKNVTLTYMNSDTVKKKCWRLHTLFRNEMPYKGGILYIKLLKGHHLL